MTAPTSDPLDSRGRATLGIIRLALLAGVLAFGAVTWFAHRRPDYHPAAPVNGPTATFSLVIGVLAIGAALLVRRAAFATTDAAKYRGLCIVGWSFGEMAALAGGIHYFMTNDPSRYAIGVLVMLCTFVLLPLRRT